MEAGRAKKEERQGKSESFRTCLAPSGEQILVQMDLLIPKVDEWGSEVLRGVRYFNFPLGGWINPHLGTFFKKSSYNYLFIWHKMQMRSWTHSIITIYTAISTIITRLGVFVVGNTVNSLSVIPTFKTPIAIINRNTTSYSQPSQPHVAQSYRNIFRSILIPSKAIYPTEFL